jgi:hypothetical protein
MVIRVDVLVFAFPVAETFQRQVGNHLVGVHVGRGTRTPLDEIGDELVAHLAGDQPVAGPDNGIGHPCIEHAEIAIGQSAAAFLT